MTSGRERDVGVVGCGAWGENLVRNFAEIGRLRAVCDVDERARDRATSIAPGVDLHADLGALLADERIRAVAVATPASTHDALALRCLEAGRDVFVEKPFALGLVEGRRVVERAAELERVVMVGHVLQYHPAVERLLELLREGRLGELRYVYSHRLNLGRVRREENVVWSFAPHDISVLLRLFGRSPESVLATGGTFLQPDVADVTVSCLLFEGGARGHVFVSWLHPFREQRLVVIGSRGMATFEDGPPAPRLTFFDQGVDMVEGRPVPRRDAGGTDLELPDEEPLRRECLHFLDCVDERRTPLTDGRWALDCLSILDASQRSLAAGGEPVDLAD